MDATSDGVMTAVYLKEVVDDYSATVQNGGKSVSHRYGCSGVDGTAFGKIPGGEKESDYLFVSYGVYSDLERTDNDYQVILCYDTSDWAQYAQPLDQEKMHHSGPETPAHKFFIYTGNTTYGVQNLEYDAATGNFLMAVYRGKRNPSRITRCMQSTARKHLRAKRLSAWSRKRKAKCCRFWTTAPAKGRPAGISISAAAECARLTTDDFISFNRPNPVVGSGRM